MSIKGTTMWVGTVRSLTFAEQVRASAAAGCRTMSFTPLDYVRTLAAGLTTADMISIAADEGIKITHLDPLARWLPEWIPDVEDEAIYAELCNAPLISFDGDDFFRIAEALKVESMTAVATCSSVRVTEQKLTDHFAVLCDRAADFGIRVDLEFVAYLGLNDLKTTWNVVRKANRPNSGIIFDIWHYMRGKPDDALLQTIPGEMIAGVQLSDATLLLPSGVRPMDDMLLRRVEPGEGEFPITRVLKILDEIGGLNRVGPEIFSSQYDTFEEHEIAKRCAASMARIFDEAKIAHQFA